MGIDGHLIFFAFVGQLPGEGDSGWVCVCSIEACVFESAPRMLEFIVNERAQLGAFYTHLLLK